MLVSLRHLHIQPLGPLHMEHVSPNSVDRSVLNTYKNNIKITSAIVSVLFKLFARPSTSTPETVKIAIVQY